ncbi:MAG TPA: ATP-binding cassette domain-containing protein, partial [Candidatus Dormibacteraeota bacterium]|nr:ATP-binding cassette domain-containing protein [Candidatus Dormibacteraeota bacterium]
KIAAFTVSAAVAAVAGGVYGTTLGFISPESFSIKLSIFALVSCVLGGLGTAFGPVLGTALLYGFEQVAARTAQGDVLMFGVLLIVLPLFLTRGLAGALAALVARLDSGRRSRAERERTAALPTPGSSMAKMSTTLRLPRRDQEIFQLREINRSFGALRALAGVSLEARPGEIVGIVGPNGAGKTTLLNIASGYYAPSSGAVRLGAADITRVSMHERARLGVIPTFQHPQLMDSSSVLENLEAGLLVDHGATARNGGRRVREVAEDLGLTAFLSTLAGDLPYGPRKILEVARALVSEPRVLLLDEPTSGITPADVEMVANAIRIARGRGVAIVLADHRVEFVTGVCDHVVVLSNGALLAAGRPAEVTANPAVVEAYLGTPSRVNHA